MDSIAPECTELKLSYESCFNTWYEEKFLKGKKDNDCKSLFIKYRNCLEKTLKEKNIDVLLEEHDKIVNPIEGEKFDINKNNEIKDILDQNTTTTTTTMKEEKSKRPFLWGLFT